MVFSFNTFLGFQEPKTGLFGQDMFGTSESDTQLLAAATYGTENEEFNQTSLTSLELDARHHLQRPLVELNRNTKCQQGHSQSVNSAIKNLSVPRTHLVTLLLSLVMINCSPLTEFVLS